MLLRLLPPPFGSPGRILALYFVATTKRSRSFVEAINSPRWLSLVPPVYPFAVSMKFPPTSRKVSNRARLVFLSHTPSPFLSPHVIVPRASSLPRSPLLPNSLYRIRGTEGFC